MHARRPKDRRRTRTDPTRSRAAVIAVIAWWVAAVLGIMAWQLLNRGFGESPARWLSRVGTWLVGFCVLGQVVGIGASIGALLRDHGRVRAGALLLLLLPVIGGVTVWIGVSSTMLNPVDLLMPGWLVISGAVLLIGSLLIMAPTRLGVD